MSLGFYFLEGLALDGIGGVYTCLSEDLIDQGHVPYRIGRALGHVGPRHANVPQSWSQMVAVFTETTWILQKHHVFIAYKYINIYIIYI